MPRSTSTSRRKPSPRFEQLRTVASRFEGWAPPREVLTSVRAVPTVFPQLDVATRIGGWPIQRVALIHGPSNHGKSLLLHGLGLSFLHAGGYYLLVDAEYTTDDIWLHKLLGDQLEHPGFLAKRPVNYEQTVESVRSALKGVIRSKQSGELDVDAPVLLGVDSLTKLVPEKILDKIAEDEGGVDGMKGRAAMIKAAFNSAWLDELVPQLYEAGACFSVITRESANVSRSSPWEPEWTLKGGQAIQYESSLTARVTRSGYVKVGDRVVGERHQVLVRKTKVGGKDDKTVSCHFHSSNGTEAPEGFDRARDVVELAIEHVVLKKAKSGGLTDSETGESWRSEAECAKQLRAAPQELSDLEQRARKVAHDAVQQGAMVTAPDAPEEPRLAGVVQER